MITIHYLTRSRAHRIAWLLEELAEPYEIVRYERDPKTGLAPAALCGIHPLGKSPVVTDGGLVVAESGAIVSYLLGQYGNGRLIPPQGTEERLRYIHWVHHAEGSAMPYVVMRVVCAETVRQSPALARPLVGLVSKGVRDGFVDPQLRLCLDYWESELARAHWFAGDAFTAADIMMSFPVEAASLLLGGLGNWPNVGAWLERARSRPAYERAVERAGPDGALAA